MTITTSNSEIGAEEENIATITFTPDTALPSYNGIIEIYTPVWSQKYDSATGETEIEYPIGSDSLSCESEHFSNFVLSKSESILTLAYYEFSGEALEPIIITCTDWRNPNAPYEQFGYSLKTFNKNMV